MTVSEGLGMAIANMAANVKHSLKKYFGLQA